MTAAPRADAGNSNGSSAPGCGPRTSGTCSSCAGSSLRGPTRRHGRRPGPRGEASWPGCWPPRSPTRAPTTRPRCAGASAACWTGWQVAWPDLAAAVDCLRRGAGRRLADAGGHVGRGGPQRDRRPQAAERVPPIWPVGPGLRRRDPAQRGLAAVHPVTEEPGRRAGTHTRPRGIRRAGEGVPQARPRAKLPGRSRWAASP